MKCYVLCVLVCVGFGTTQGWERGDLEKYGPFQLLLKSMIKCDHTKTLNLDVSDINVYFYDFSKSYINTFPIEQAAKGILGYRNLDIKKKFIIFVGGYKSNINKNAEERVMATFGDFPNSYLVILDHSPYTNDKHGRIKSYERAVQYSYYIGKELAEMLTGMLKGGISAKSMHAIGHSLGGQILGYTGEIFYENTGAKIWRVTALDPAGPCFVNSLVEEQVRSGVAEYVEVYHCNAGGLGSSSVLADVDFFLNAKGQSQPNCGTPLIPGIFDSQKASKCSHRACVEIWLETVKNPKMFTASKCDKYAKFKKGECARNEVTIAGFWNPGNAKGVFYFTTEGFKGTYWKSKK